MGGDRNMRIAAMYEQVPRERPPYERAWPLILSSDKNALLLYRRYLFIEWKEHRRLGLFPPYFPHSTPKSTIGCVPVPPHEQFLHLPMMGMVPWAEEGYGDSAPVGHLSAVEVRGRR